MRDEFTKQVVRTLQERAGNRCSNPKCRCLTSGPNSVPDKATRIGVAAHVTAAAQGGPRYDPVLSTADRRSIANGVWLCQNCARLVDVDETTYPSELLVNWRSAAEMLARSEIEGGPQATTFDEPELETFDGWSCPHCGTVVQDGRHVCIGCYAEVVYGATRQERQNIMNTGLFFGGVLSALTVFALPNWLASEFSLNLVPGWGLGVYSIIPIALAAILTAFVLTSLEDARRRREPPRFFRSSVA